VIGGDGGSLGPDLAGLFQRRNDEWIRVQIQNPRAHNPASVTPELGLTSAQVDPIMETLRDSP
jgi:cbb3-type cytochrome oxidase cytochrome c subunit